MQHRTQTVVRPVHRFESLARDMAKFFISSRRLPRGAEALSPAPVPGTVTPGSRRPFGRAARLLDSRQGNAAHARDRVVVRLEACTVRWRRVGESTRFASRIEPHVQFARPPQRLRDELFGVAPACLEPGADLPRREALEVVQAEHLPIALGEVPENLADQERAIQPLLIHGGCLLRERCRPMDLVRTDAGSPIRAARVAHRCDEPRPRILDLNAGIQEGEERLLDERLAVVLWHVELSAGDVEKKIPVVPVQAFHVVRAQAFERLLR
jgi:hypothetical protein